MDRINRLEHALAILERCYLARKHAGRPYGHLLTRCRRLSQAWLAERHAHLTR